MPRLMTIGSSKVRAISGYLRVACALIILVGPTAALLDETAHRHAICAQHGDLVHVEAHTTALHDCTSGAHPHDESASLRAIGDAPSGHDHEHCLVAVAAVKKEFVQPRMANAFAPVVISTSVRAEIDVQRISSISLIALAPKTSPPSA
jgi:hypothetical protein